MKKLFLSFIVYFLFSVNAFAGTSEVTLQWDQSLDHQYLRAYKVYWGTVAGEFPKPNAAEAGLLLNFTTPPLSDGTYYFVVTAIDTRGLESIPSNEISLALDTAPPRSPRNLKSVSVKITVSMPSGTVTVVQTTGR